MDPVTLYHPDGRPVVVSSPREVTNLKASGYRTEKPFVPAEHPVGEVQQHLADADDAERARVLAAEKSGKARTTITGGQ